jgi:fatty acid desaturase
MDEVFSSGEPKDFPSTHEPIRRSVAAGPPDPIHMLAEPIRIDIPKTDSKLFAFTRMDAIPVLAGIFHFAYFWMLFLLFPHSHKGLLGWPNWEHGINGFAGAPLWVMLLLGFIYSISISWNINGISHNFIHNPYFRAPLLNRLFSLLESITCCFSQVYYDVVHMQHHKGNSDRPDETGDTIDWISIYRHGHDGEAENPWAYTFLSFFRDNPAAIGRELAKRGGEEMRWGKIELASFITVMIAIALMDWRYMIFFFLPFMYLGHSLSYLNGYYRHYGGNPDKPIAWGVSTYEKLYNWTWFYNGYHAEHHFRPKVHWTKMVELHRQIADLQKAEGVRVIKPPHALGFLDPDLPPRRQTARPATEAVS